MVACKICSHSMNKIFDEKVLHKYTVSYFKCDECSIIQTEQPFWLGEAYSDAIVKADTGLVMRNIKQALQMAALIHFHFDPKSSFVDVAGGYGILTRLMRDFGFNYYWDDPYCENLLARGFESKHCDKQITAISAFEVMEHIEDPINFIKSEFDKYKCQTIIFSTLLYDDASYPNKDWWYYTFSTGQHISIYHKKTFNKIAQILNLNFYSFNGIHILTDQKLSLNFFTKLLTSKLSFLSFLWSRLRLNSLTMKDHTDIIRQS